MIGRLLDELGPASQLDRTLLVVAADHGESLGEHGERTHGVFAYDVTMRVPWIIWAGGRIAPRSSATLSRLIDLAPTTLDLVGVAAPVEFEGHSIVAAITTRQPAGAQAYLEAVDASLTRNWAPLTALVSGTYKLIDLPIPELYDLAADPRETTNVYARAAETARTLESLLRDTRSMLGARPADARRSTPGADARQRLKALGYVASSAGPRPRVYTAADDPKMLIGVSDELNRA